MVNELENHSAYRDKPTSEVTPVNVHIPCTLPSEISEILDLDNPGIIIEEKNQDFPEEVIVSGCLLLVRKHTYIFHAYMKCF